MTRMGSSQGTMKRLPAEILSDIFLKALPGPFDELGPPTQLTFSITVPLYISHVCRAWRSLALSTGHLWSRLFLAYLPRQREDKGRRIVEIFDTWLSRAEGAPLDYAFRCHLDGGAGEHWHDIEAHGYAEHIITRLLSQQFRWRKVHFSWHHVNFSSGFPELQLIDMPMLESLSFSSDTGLFATIDVARSPLLRMVNVYGRFSLVTGEAPLRYLREPSRLTFWNLTSGTQSIPSCLNFLRVATSLTEIHIEFCGPPEPSPYTGSRILLPNIRAFRLTGNVSPTRIDALTLPSLEALSFMCNDEDNLLLRFLNRSSPPLTYLDVRNSRADETTLLPILRTLPTLKDLRIDIASVSSRFFHELAVTAIDTKDAAASPVKDQVICPRMETLRLGILLFTEGIAACTEALIDMLKCRATIADSFKSICYNYDIQSARVVSVSELDEHAEELGRCFEEGGLIVGSYSSPPYPFDL